MKNEFEATLTLNHPLTEEDMDILTDVDFDHTSRVWFYTKHGKEVEFVKVTRCENCKHCKIIDYYTTDNEKYVTMYHCKLFDDVLKNNDDFCNYGERKNDEIQTH